MNQRKYDPQSGKSLIELMLVLIIVGVLVTISITRFGQAEVKFQRQNIARALKVYLERARFDSVKRRATGTADMARVTLTGATSYTFTNDMNQNGRIDANESTIIDFSGRSATQILGNNLSFPVTIRFDQRGQATATNSAGTEITPTFTVCECTTLSNSNPQNASVISVSPTGTVAMLLGGQTMPTFQSPNVTNVNSNSNINPCLYIGNANTSSQECS